jgi:glycosyltransferase involved in cell wall biosynthesis
VNVLVYTTLYPNNVWPNHGVFVKERMTNFARLEDCRVEVVAPVPYFPRLRLGRRWQFSQVAAHERRDGLAVHHPRYLMTPKVGMSLYGITMFLSVLPFVRRLRSTFDFDLIDAHFLYPDGMAAVLLGRALGVPVVVSARGTDVNLYAEWPLIRRLLRFTLRQADAAVAVCQALKTEMVELDVPETEVTVVSNGVDTARFHRVPRDEARRLLGLPAAERVILAVGNLIPRKSFDLMIQAFHALLPSVPDTRARLVIVGEGPERRALEALARTLGLGDAVRFAGAIPHDRLATWYSAADVSCLTSSREGWPNVVLESLACGTPVVAAAIWGVPEIIQSERLGVLVERDVRSVAEGLRQALARPWDTDELIRYSAQHTWDAAARQLLGLFRGVLRRRAATPARGRERHRLDERETGSKA